MNSVDKDIEQFQADLLKSVREMKGKERAARVTSVAPTEASRGRAKVGLSQSEPDDVTRGKS